MKWGVGVEEGLHGGLIPLEALAALPASVGPAFLQVLA